MGIHMRFSSTRLTLLSLLISAPALLPLPASAALPKPEAPSRGESGGLLKIFQNYGYDAAVLGGLGIATLAFIVVSVVCIGKFQEVSTKKANWSEFFTFMAVGAVILVVVIWLVNEASKIL